jgi:ankyrin repeat protein
MSHFYYFIGLALAFSSIPTFGMKRELDDKEEPAAKVAKTEENAQSEQVNKALIAAVKNNQSQVVEHLLNSGANINVQDEDGSTPLTIAVGLENITIIALLLAKGAMKQYFVECPPALKIAIRKENKEILSMLIQAASTIRAPIMMFGHKSGERDSNQDRILKWSLYEAIEIGSLEIVKYILDQGAHVNTRLSSRSGFYGQATPLKKAVYHKHKKLIAFLLSKGADVLDNGNAGFPSASFDAGVMNDYELIESLIQNESDLTRIEAIRTDALAGACLEGHYELAKKLLSDGANSNGYVVTPVVTPGDSLIFNALPITYAIKGKNKDIIELLISKGANLQVRRDINTLNAVSVAASLGDIDLVKRSIEDNKKSSDDKSFALNQALVIAVGKGNYELAQMLLNEGADPNAVGLPFFNTPMMQAVCSVKSIDESVKFIKLLKSAGAVSKPVNTGNVKTVLQCALGNKIANLTMLMGLEVFPVEEACLKHLAWYLTAPAMVFHDAKNCVKYSALLQQDKEGAAAFADLNAECKEKRRLLKMIQESKQLQNYIRSPKAVFGESFLKLLQNDKDCLSDKQQTVLMWACMFDNADIVNALLKLENLPTSFINAQDIYGRTALMYALVYRHFKIAEKLIPLCGQSINRKDAQGNTALFYAAKNGAAHCTQELLRRGAQFGNSKQIGLVLERASRKGYHLIILSLLGNFSQDFKALLPNNNNPFL